MRLRMALLTTCLFVSLSLLNGRAFFLPAQNEINKKVGSATAPFSAHAPDSLILPSVVNVSDLPVAMSFGMPIGDSVAGNLNLLSIASFVNYNYPKIRFNENGNGKTEINEWFVATAF